MLCNSDYAKDLIFSIRAEEPPTISKASNIDTRTVLAHYHFRHHSLPKPKFFFKIILVIHGCLKGERFRHAVRMHSLPLLVIEVELSEIYI